MLSEISRPLYPDFWTPQKKPSPGSAVLRVDHPLYDRILACIPFDERAGTPRELRHGLTLSNSNGHAWKENFHGPAVNVLAEGFQLTGNAMQSSPDAITYIVLKYNDGTQGNDWQYVVDTRSQGGDWMYISNSNTITFGTLNTGAFSGVQASGLVGISAVRDSVDGTRIEAKNFDTGDSLFASNAYAINRGFGSGSSIFKKYNSNAENLRGDLLLFMAIAAQLSRADIMDIWMDPWQFFESAYPAPNLANLGGAPPVGTIVPQHFHHRHHNRAG